MLKHADTGERAAAAFLTTHQAAARERFLRYADSLEFVVPNPGLHIARLYGGHESVRRYAPRVRRRRLRVSCRVRPERHASRRHN